MVLRFFLYPDNQKFVEGKVKDLSGKREIIENLNRQIGIPIQMGNLGCCSGCVLIYASILALALAVGLIAFSIDDIFRVNTASSIIFFGIGVYIIGSLLRWFYSSRRTRQRYKLLLDSGRIMTGQVLNITQVMIGEGALIDTGTEITFEFEMQDSRKIQGKYCTRLKHLPQSGDQIAILYHSDRLYTLL